MNQFADINNKHFKHFNHKPLLSLTKNSARKIRRTVTKMTEECREKFPSPSAEGRGPWMECRWTR